MKTLRKVDHFVKSLFLWITLFCFVTFRSHPFANQQYDQLRLERRTHFQGEKRIAAVCVVLCGQSGLLQNRSCYVHLDISMVLVFLREYRLTFSLFLMQLNVVVNLKRTSLAGTYFFSLRLQIILIILENVKFL